MSLKSYAVWDAPTRWFHWINFICVVALAVLGTANLYYKDLGVKRWSRLSAQSFRVDKWSVCRG